MSGKRGNGDYGQLKLPVNEGIQLVNVELALQASATVGGKTYANRVFKHAMTHWNIAKTFSARIQGIVGAAGIAVGTGNDSVKTEAAIRYFKDNGAELSAAADAAIAVTRPAAAKKNWNLIVLDIDDGAITAVAGTDGDAFVDTFGAAGGPPLVAVDKLIIGGVKLSSEVAAPVAASEIVYELSTGASIQERSDIPTFDYLPLEGGVRTAEELPACHTGGIPRKIYGSFWSQKGALTTVGHSKEWKVSGSRSVTELAAQGDVSSPKDYGQMSFTGSFSRFRVDESMHALAAHRETGYVRLYPDSREAGYYEAAVIITSWDEGSAKGAERVANVGFAIYGDLEWRAA